MAKTLGAQTPAAPKIKASGMSYMYIPFCRTIEFFYHKELCYFVPRNIMTQSSTTFLSWRQTPLSEGIPIVSAVLPGYNVANNHTTINMHIYRNTTFLG